MVISSRSEASEIRCPNCGLVQPAPEAAPGPAAPRDAPAQPPRPRTLVPIAGPPPKERTLAADGLRAILYALRALPRMLVVVLAMMGANVLYELYFGSISVFLSHACLFQILLPLATGVAWYAMIGFALRFFLDVAVSSLERVDKTPGVPRLGLGALFEGGLTGLGLLVVYVLPVVTLPLLPLGLLAAAWSDDTRALDPLWAFRAARRHPRPLAVLWAVLLLWGGLLGAGAWLAGRAADSWIDRLLHQRGEPLWAGLLIAAVTALGSLALALIGCVFGAVLFRCVGLLGRYHPEVLDTLPEKPPSTSALVCYIGAGVAAALLVQAAVFLILGGA